MSVIRCNNNLWLRCVSIGSECLWLAVGEIPYSLRLDMGGRTSRWREDCENDGWCGNGTEWNGWREWMVRLDGWVRWMGRCMEYMNEIDGWVEGWSRLMR